MTDQEQAEPTELEKTKKLVAAHKARIARDLTNLATSEVSPAELAAVVRLEGQLQGQELFEQARSLTARPRADSPPDAKGAKAKAGRAKTSGGKPRKAPAARAPKARRRSTRKTG